MPVDGELIGSLFLKCEETIMPISAVKDVTLVEPGESDPRTEERFSDFELSFNIPMTPSATDRIIHILGVQRKYTRRRYNHRRVWHLIKYGKTKRIRHKNWKRSFGKRVF